METDKKRVYWLDEEVETMLRIIREKDILRLLDGKTRRNNIVYKRISNGMRLKNFHKSSDQIKSKLRFMKKCYFEAKQTNTSGNDRKTCPYFELLDEMYDKRPLFKTEVKELVEDPAEVIECDEKKRVHWLDEEVETMLEIIRQNDILRKLEGKTRRNNMVYKRISEGLKLKNFHKSSDQIKTKLRFVKKNYLEFKRNNDTSDSDRKTCPYFELLDKMYDNARPGSPTVWMDTSIDDEREVITFPDVEDSAEICELDSEVENASLTITSDDSSVTMPRKHQPSEKISLPQALAKMTEEFKKGIDRLTEQNEIFLREQRNLNAELMLNMHQLLTDDREATKRFLEKLLNKK